MEDKKVAKSQRKTPAVVQPLNMARVATVAGRPDPISLEYSEGFVDKHILGKEGSAIGKKKTVITGSISSFAPGRITPNRHGPGDRLVLASQPYGRHSAKNDWKLV